MDPSHFSYFCLRCPAGLVCTSGAAKFQIEQRKVAFVFHAISTNGADRIVLRLFGKKFRQCPTVKAALDRSRNRGRQRKDSQGYGYRSKVEDEFGVSFLEWDESDADE